MHERSLSYQKISLLISIAYTVCVTVFLGLYFRGLYAEVTVIKLCALWTWIITPQFILLVYVSKFRARWAQFISILLQIGLCSALYNYGIPALTNDYDDIKYELAYFFLPIWHYAIVIASGLVMKIIDDY